MNQRSSSHSKVIFSFTTWWEGEENTWRRTHFHPSRKGLFLPLQSDASVLKEEEKHTYTHTNGAELLELSIGLCTGRPTAVM